MQVYRLQLICCLCTSIGGIGFIRNVGYVCEIMKIKIALITGGYTDEVEVSLKSSEFVYSQLDPSKYDVYKVIITRDNWLYVGENGVSYAIDRNHFTLPLDGA